VSRDFLDRKAPMRHPSQVDHEIGDLLALLYVDDAGAW
jgi:hypothetical protein